LQDSINPKPQSEGIAEEYPRQQRNSKNSRFEKKSKDSATKYVIYFFRKSSNVENSHQELAKRFIQKDTMKVKC
jgi:hypothetical protein